MFQALSAVYPFYFKSEEMFETLLTFLRHDDECVCKCYTVCQYFFIQLQVEIHQSSA